MKSLLGHVLGAWLAFGTIALFVRTVRPKDTAITCAWCGHPISMTTALDGGIGAVNLAMRDHMLECEGHPLHAVQQELIRTRAAMKTIHILCEKMPHSPAFSATKATIDSIMDTAGRKS